MSGHDDRLGTLRAVMDTVRRVVSEWDGLLGEVETLAGHRDAERAATEQREREHGELREAHERLEREHRALREAHEQLGREHQATAAELAELRVTHAAVQHAHAAAEQAHAAAQQAQAVVGEDLRRLQEQSAEELRQAREADAAELRQLRERSAWLVQERDRTAEELVMLLGRLRA